MTVKVILQAQNDNNSSETDISIEMSVFPVDYTSTLSNIVYEDKNYNIIVKNDDKTINNFELYINDELIEINNTFIKEPFKRLYGITDIRLEIDNKIFYSTPLCVAINQRNIEYEKSIKKMIDEILSKEQNLLRTKESFQNSREKIKLHKNLNINEEIKLLKRIINTYNKNYLHFSINPYTKCSQIYEKNKTEKLNSIDYKTVQYIAANPHEFRYHNTPTGMTYNKMPITPENTLVKTTIKSLDLYENKQILGFINTISQYVDYKVNEILNIKNEKQIVKTKQNVLTGYKLSTQIIEYYSTAIYVESYNELVKIKQEIISIKNKYENCLKMTTKPIKTIPKPTPIFMEIYHYRQIFSVIKEWFSNERNNIPDPSIILNFPSADKIYELYTLINLYENICNSGYEITNRPINFDYNRHDKIYKPTKFNNTFEFKKDNTRLTLYFQPVVTCSNKNLNNINLCRLNGKNGYYYPDFIIKKETKDKTEYSILDSKWSTLYSIKYENSYKKNWNTWKECIFRYYFSIARTDTASNMERISNLWLVSGKSSSEQIYYHNQNNLAENNPKLKNSMGIVTLTPDDTKLEFNRIIQFIIK